MGATDSAASEYRRYAQYEGVLERITYGAVGLALAGLATAILALVLKGGG